jgi:glycosyltransferase involved in cell wall biosynthesis
MKILHLAAGNRWTGAAAPAFAEVVALREAGVDAHYAYVGGYKLEAKIGHLEFAHAIIEKAQNPAALRRSVRAIRALIARHGINIVHAHLTYDHWLAFFAGGTIARTFHSERVLRRDPFTRMLMNRTKAVFIVNDAFRRSPALHNEHPIFTPPPLDRAQFTPDGPNVRARYGLESASPLIVAIGKLSRDRGFETALSAFALVRARHPNARLMIIGHGEHRPALERHAADLQIAPDVVWAGYHEDDLAEHYRAADLMLFTAAGSDAGHRAVLEAMACGVVPVVAPLGGMHALLRGFDSLIAADATSEAIAACTLEVTASVLPPMRARLLRHSDQFAYPRAAERLETAYAMLL